MSDKTKNEHYVPQSYLKRFAENEKLTVYYIMEKTIYTNQNSRNYAAKRSIYDTKHVELKELLKEMIEITPELEQSIDWTDSQLIEHYFSRCENEMNVLFDQIEETPDILKNDDCIAKLTVFLHDMAYRNIAYRKTIEKINATTLEELSATYIDDKRKKAIEHIFGKENARLQQLHSITDLHPVLHTYKKLFGKYNLFFATVAGDARFVISDNPAHWFLLDAPELCYPLSGKHALIFRKPGVVSRIMGTDKPIGDRISITIPNVVRYNLLQFCSANRYVFGDYHNLSQMKLLWENIKYNQKGS